MTYISLQAYKTIRDIGLRKDSGNSDIDVIFVVYCATLSVSLYAIYGRRLLNDF